jgi:predicted nucleic acid-binding protein
MSEFTLALDTNFLQALFQSNHVHHGKSVDVLVQYADAPVVICPMVFSEALCIPSMTLAQLELYLGTFDPKGFRTAFGNLTLIP